MSKYLTDNEITLIKKEILSILNNKDGYNTDGIDRDGYNFAGFNKAGFDREGYNFEGYDKNNLDRYGFINPHLNLKSYLDDYYLSDDEPRDLSLEGDMPNEN